MKNLHEQVPAETPKISTSQWSYPARVILAVMFVFTLLALFIFISPIGRDLAAALLFAFVFDIPIRFIVRRTSLKYRWSALIVYILLYIVLALLLLIGWRFLVNYLQGMITNLSHAASAFLTKLQGTAGGSASSTLSIAGIGCEWFLYSNAGKFVHERVYTTSG